MDAESALFRLRERIESTAEWRRRKALECPEESRHVEAVGLLDKLGPTFLTYLIAKQRRMQRCEPRSVVPP